MFSYRERGSKKITPAYSMAARLAQSPNRAGWGSFTPAYKSGQPARLPQSPNRQVGDLSLQPTSRHWTRLAQSPNLCRLGDSFASPPAASAVGGLRLRGGDKTPLHSRSEPLADWIARLSDRLASLRSSATL
jgi:hypothetical protein